MEPNQTAEMPATEKPKRKYARKAKPVAKAEANSEFAGLTALDCCEACNEKKCVISGINVCGHPFKGGLQSPQMRQPEALRRFNRARLVLAGQKLRID